MSAGILEGELFKKSGSKFSLSGWDKRWFVLRKDSLDYYKSSDKKDQRGSISLANVTGIANTDAGKKGAHAFEVVTRERTYILCAASADLRSQWLEELQRTREVPDSTRKLADSSEEPPTTPAPVGLEVTSGAPGNSGPVYDAMDIDLDGGNTFVVKDAVVVVSHNFSPDTQGSYERGYLDLTVRGHVSKACVSAINDALSNLSRIRMLQGGLQPLRLCGGMWTFYTACDPQFFPDILIQCFIVPLEDQAFELVPMDNVATFAHPFVHISTSQLRSVLHQHLVFQSRKALESYFPLSNRVFGGDGKFIRPISVGSVSIKPDTRIEYPRGSPVTCLGLGWTPDTTRTYETIEGAQDIDLDVGIFMSNKWGAPMQYISPKRPGPVAGFKMGKDSGTGEGAGDDEVLAIDFDKVHPAVHTFVVCISILKGPTSFKHVRDVYVRGIDCTRSSQDMETWRYNLPQDASPARMCTMGVMVFERDVASPGAWIGRTVQTFVPPREPGWVPVCTGDVVQALDRGNISLKRTELGGDGFSTNVERLRAAPRPLTVTLKRGFVNELLREPGYHSWGEEYDIQLLTNENALHFCEGPAECMVVEHVAEEIREVTAINPVWFPKLFGLKDDNVKAPTRAVISNLFAYIPACDLTGTSDPFVYVFKQSLNTGMIGRDVQKTDIYKGPVIKNLKCPAIVDFAGAQFAIPVKSSVGIIEDATLAVYDADRMSRDDPILEHKIDLTWQAQQGGYKGPPTKVFDISDHPQNQGFTKDLVWIKYTLELE